MKATRKTSGTIKKAQRILEDQKKDYKRIFKNELRRSKNSKIAAVRAGSTYRTLYGSTPQKRWQNALKRAKESLF